MKRHSEAPASTSGETPGVDPVTGRPIPKSPPLRTDADRKRSCARRRQDAADRSAEFEITVLRDRGTSEAEARREVERAREFEERGKLEQRERRERHALKVANRSYREQRLKACTNVFRSRQIGGASRHRCGSRSRQNRPAGPPRRTSRSSSSSDDPGEDPPRPQRGSGLGRRPPSERPLSQTGGW